MSWYYRSHYCVINKLKAAEVSWSSVTWPTFPLKQLGFPDEGSGSVCSLRAAGNWLNLPQVQTPRYSSNLISHSVKTTSNNCLLLLSHQTLFLIWACVRALTERWEIWLTGCVKTAETLQKQSVESSDRWLESGAETELLHWQSRHTKWLQHWQTFSLLTHLFCVSSITRSTLCVWKSDSLFLFLSFLWIAFVKNMELDLQQ